MTIRGLFGEEIEVSTSVCSGRTRVMLDVSEGDTQIAAFLSLDEATKLRDALDALLAAEQEEMKV